MFKSVTGLQLRADSLIRSYHAWAVIDGPLHAQTDTRNGPKFVGELRSLASQFAMYAKQAREVMASDGFNDLDPNVIDDITAIAEEGEAGVAELDDETQPDKKWSKLDPQVKADITARAHADGDAVARIRSRGNMEVRAAKAKQPKK